MEIRAFGSWTSAQKNKLQRSERWGENLSPWRSTWISALMSAGYFAKHFLFGLLYHLPFGDVWCHLCLHRRNPECTGAI